MGTLEYTNNLFYFIVLTYKFIICEATLGITG